MTVTNKQVVALAVLSLVALPEMASAYQANEGREAPDSTASFHRTLSDSTKHVVYSALLSEAGDIIAEVWGQPADWVELCGTEPEGPKNTWSLDATIRSPFQYPGFTESYSPALLPELLEQQLIFGVCESHADNHLCTDSTKTMTLALSTIFSGDADTVIVKLWLRRRRPGCPGRTSMGGFGAAFLITLARRDGVWAVTRKDLQRIT